MVSSPAVLGSGWIIVYTLTSSLVTVCVRLTDGRFSYAGLLLAEYWLVTLVCAAVMYRRRISFTSPCWKAQFLRLFLGVTCACCALTIRQGLPVGLAQTFLYSTPVFVMAGLLIPQIMRGRVDRIGIFCTAAIVICAVTVAFTFRPGLDGLTPWMCLAGIGFGVTATAAAFCLRYLGDRGEPVVRTVFYFGAGACAGSLAAELLTDTGELTLLLSEPILFVLAVLIAVSQLAKVYGWGYCSPWLNAVFLFSGIPAALGLGYVFFGEELSGQELVMVSVISVTALLCAGCLKLKARKQPVETD